MAFLTYENKMKAVLVALGFLLLLSTSIASDGYFLWLCLSGSPLTVVWNRKPIFSVSTPFFQGPKVPLWVPLASLLILLGYLTVVGRRLNLEISLWRRRLHHYHLGIFSIGLSLLLTAPLLLPGFQDSPIWVASKGTSLSEVLEGLSFIFLISGVSLTIIDARDLLSVVKTWLKLGKEGKSTTT